VLTLQSREMQSAAIAEQGMKNECSSASSFQNRGANYVDGSFALTSAP
jgi:hypothetical protein